MRLGELPQSVMQLIYGELNTNTYGKNYEALAGWFDFTNDQFKHFKLEKNPTAAILDSWGMKSENTVPKFLEILEQNEMTNLVDEIRKKLKHR